MFRFELKITASADMELLKKMNMTEEMFIKKIKEYFEKDLEDNDFKEIEVTAKKLEVAK